MLSLWLRRASRASLTLLGLASAACSAAEPTRMSVVLVVVDTLRADRLGAYGSVRGASPELDRLTSRGVVFERAYATSPWTLPSFGSLLTGRLPSHHAAGLRVAPEQAGPAAARPGMKIETRAEEIVYARLDPDVAVLPEILREAGYATAAVVSNPFLWPGMGLARGFDLYDYEAGSDEEARRADVAIDRALTWLSEASPHQPYFLMLHLFDPHMNYDAPPPVRGRYTDELTGGLSLPVRGSRMLRRRAGKLPPAVRNFVAAAYDEEVAFVDRELGRFLGELERRGLFENGLVILSSDHGEELFERNGFGHGHSFYDEVLRIPLILWGAVTPGMVTHPVSLTDIAPTVLESAGLPAPRGISGVSLWPFLRGEAKPAYRPVFAEATAEGAPGAAVIDWPWKLIARSGTAPRLYDLSSDAAERSDVSSKQPEQLRALAARLAAVRRDGATPVAAEMDTGTRRKLEALGYLE